MKPLIFGSALIVLFTMFLVFQNDNNTYLRYQEKLKYVAEEASNSAMLFYDEDEFGNGRKIFDLTKGNQIINMLLQSNLKDADETTCIVYYFDDSGKRRKYENGVLKEEENFLFNFLFTETLTGYQKLITEPTVIVTLVGKGKFRLSFLADKDIFCIRTSGYEYKT